MPSWRVEFCDGTAYKLKASSQKDAIARAQRKYRRKNGKAGEVKRVR
jgi:hypothetical protein